MPALRGRSLVLLFVIIHTLCITNTRTYPTAVTQQAQTTSADNDAAGNIAAINAYTYNKPPRSHQVFEIPPGIFTTYAQLPTDTITHTAHDTIDDTIDTDDYVPYRSDVHDRFSWALIKQILLSSTALATARIQRPSNIIKSATNGAASAAAAVTDNTDNIIFSPFSVKLVLALLTEATGNGTRAQSQLLTTLGDIKATENLRSFYRKTLASLKKENPHYTLLLETRLYTDTSVKPLPSYGALLQSAYDTPIEQLNFANGIEASDKINSWIARATKGRLQQLVSEEGVANSVMLLVNAIYFNGLWRRQFTESYPGVFFRTLRHQVKTSFMELTDDFFYYQCNDLRAKIIRLPYRGQKFSMFVVLPNEGQTVDTLLRRMQNEQLKHMQWMMERTKLRVVLPKFKFAHKTDLKSALCRLGVVDIFTDKAELSGIVEDKDSRLMVSNILQKSGIDVNELGTEAYAATEVEIVNRFGGSEYVEEFIVNRPFAFFIEEESTGNILFAGKVKNPAV